MTSTWIKSCAASLVRKGQIPVDDVESKSAGSVVRAVQHAEVPCIW